MDSRSITVSFFFIALCMMGTSINAQTDTTDSTGTSTPGGTDATGATEDPGETNTPAATRTTPPTPATRTSPPTPATRTTPPTPATRTSPPTPATGTNPPTPATRTTLPTPATRTTPPTPATRTTLPTPATRTPEPVTKLPTKTPALKKFEGDIKILQIDGVEAVFEPDYEKPESILYRNLSQKVCIAVDAALENSDAGNITGCSVSSFRKGSIVATFLMEFPTATPDISAELTTTLQEAFASSDDQRITALTVDPSSITVKEFVPNTEPPSKLPTEAPGNGTEPTTETLPPKEFEGDLKILQIDGVEAVFSPDYEKPDSILYKNLSDKVCIAVNAALENSDAGSNIERCSVSSFRKGSIVATFLMQFPPETKDISEELTKSLKEAFNNSDDQRITALTVDTSSITVKENFPITVPPKEDPGLSPGAIAGIAVGGVAAAAIIVVIIVLVVKKTGGSSKVQDVEEQELTRPSSRGKSPPPRGDSP